MHRLALGARPYRVGRLVHLYAADATEAKLLADWAARAEAHWPTQMHLDESDGVIRPTLMALLVDAQPGDLICAARAAALASAPPRARTRLSTAVKTRAIGLALLEEGIGLAQAGDGFVDAKASRAALEAVIGLAPSRAKGRPRLEDRAPHAEAAILSLLHAGRTWAQVQSALGVTRGQVARCAQRLAAVDSAPSRGTLLEEDSPPRARVRRAGD